VLTGDDLVEDDLEDRRVAAAGGTDHDAAPLDPDEPEDGR
jgi:hypothetical protein